MFLSKEAEEAREELEKDPDIQEDPGGCANRLLRYGLFSRWRIVCVCVRTHPGRTDARYISSELLIKGLHKSLPSLYFVRPGGP